MSFFVDIFNIILYKPLFNILVLFYQYIPGRDFGIAVVALTVLIKIIFYPLSAISLKSQKALSVLQPKIKEIQTKNKDNKEKQMREIMALYRKEKINPFAGLLPILIQIPVLLALYRVFWHGFEQEQLSFLYGFVLKPDSINTTFLGWADLSHPNYFFAVLAGLLQFSQTKMSLVKEPKSREKNKTTPDLAGMMQKQMQYFFPLFTVLILLKLPSALGLYWATTSVFSLIQQYFILKQKSKPA